MVPHIHTNTPTPRDIMPKDRQRHRPTSTPPNPNGYPDIWEFSEPVRRKEDAIPPARKRLDKRPLNGVPLSDIKRAELKTIDVHANRKGWHKFRPRCFGATLVVKSSHNGYDGAAAAQRQAREVLGLVEREQADRRGRVCMAYGQRFEAVALSHYEAQTRFRCHETGCHAAPVVDCDTVNNDPALGWLRAYLTAQFPEGERSQAYWESLGDFDVPYLVVTPDAEVSTAVREDGVQTMVVDGGVTDALCGAVEIKCHIDNTRPLADNRAAIVQMLCQGYCIDTDADSIIERFAWVDYCSYMCVTRYARAYGRRAKTAAQRVPLQCAEGWRMRILNRRILHALVEHVRHFREALDEYAGGSGGAPSLDFEHDLAYVPLFNVRHDDARFIPFATAAVARVSSS